MAERATKQDHRESIWIGIDLGTQSVRAVAVATGGIVIGQGNHPLTGRRDGPRHEQSPEEWWRAVCIASQNALAHIPAEAIRGVAVDGTSGTILLADRSGKPVTPGLMYDDIRATEEAKHINDVGSEVWASSGYRIQASWALPKLLWLLHRHREWIPNIRLMHQTDFINRQLAGHEVATDMSTALKTGYDLIQESWPYQVLAALNIPEEILPDVVRPGTQIGSVCTEAAAMTGIPAGTPLVAGMTDGCAAQIGAGALSVGSWNAVLGTTLVLKGVTQELLRDPAGVVYSHRSPDGHWLPGGASSTGAGILNIYFPGRNLDELSEQASKREPAGIIVYPLATQGERFPFTAPDARGFMLLQHAQADRNTEGPGAILPLPTKPGSVYPARQNTLATPVDEIDLYAAMLQGVAFIERLCFDYLDLLGAPMDGELRLTGGGTRSHYWSQLRADILARPVSIPDNAEAALGMAILAASIERPLVKVAKEMVHIREVIEPRWDHIERFHEAYLRLVDALEQLGWVPTNLAEHARRRITR